MFLRNLKHEESGATAIEYGLITALIAVMIIALVQESSRQLSSKCDADTLSSKEYQLCLDIENNTAE